MCTSKKAAQGEKPARLPFSFILLELQEQLWIHMFLWQSLEGLLGESCQSQNPTRSLASPCWLGNSGSCSPSRVPLLNSVSICMNEAFTPTDQFEWMSVDELHRLHVLGAVHLCKVLGGRRHSPTRTMSQLYFHMYTFSWMAKSCVWFLSQGCSSKRESNVKTLRSCVLTGDEPSPLSATKQCMADFQVLLSYAHTVSLLYSHSLQSRPCV